MSHSRSQTRLLTLFQDNKLDVPHQTSFPLDTLLMHIYPRIRLERLDLRGTYPGVSTPWKNTTPFVLKKRKNPFSTRESSVPPLSLSLSLIITLYTHNLLAQTSCSLLYPVHDDLTGCDAPVAHMRFAEKRCHHRAAAGLHQPPKITRAAPVKRGREEGQHIYEHNVPRMDHRLAPNPSPPPPLR